MDIKPQAKKAMKKFLEEAVSKTHEKARGQGDDDSQGDDASPHAKKPSKKMKVSKESDEEGTSDALEKRPAEEVPVHDKGQISWEKKSLLKESLTFQTKRPRKSFADVRWMSRPRTGCPMAFSTTGDCR